MSTTCRFCFGDTFQRIWVIHPILLCLAFATSHSQVLFDCWMSWISWSPGLSLLEGFRTGFQRSGGFKLCLIFPLFGEDSHFHEHIFQMGWNHQLVSQFKHLHSMSVSKTAARACSFPTVASGRSAGCSWPRGVVVAASGVKLWLYILAYTLPKWTSNFAPAFMPTGWHKPSFYRLDIGSSSILFKQSTFEDVTNLVTF